MHDIVFHTELNGNINNDTFTHYGKHLRACCHTLQTHPIWGRVYWHTAILCNISLHYLLDYILGVLTLKCCWFIYKTIPFAMMFLNYNFENFLLGRRVHCPFQKTNSQCKICILAFNEHLYHLSKMFDLFRSTWDNMGHMVQKSLFGFKTTTQTK